MLVLNALVFEVLNHPGSYLLAANVVEARLQQWVLQLGLQALGPTCCDEQRRHAAQVGSSVVGLEQPLRASALLVSQLLAQTASLDRGLRFCNHGKATLFQ